MRGDGICYAMDHAGPELGQKIWDELMRPKPSECYQESAGG